MKKVLIYLTKIGLSPIWVQSIEEDKILIKEEFQVLANKKMVRSQTFKPRHDNWPLCAKCPEELECKIQYITYVDNKVYLHDNDNTVSPKLHIKTM